MPTVKKKKPSTTEEQEKPKAVARKPSKLLKILKLFAPDRHAMTQAVCTAVLAFLGLAGWNVNTLTNDWIQQAQQETRRQVLDNLRVAALRVAEAVEQEYIRPLRRQQITLGEKQRHRAKEMALEQLKLALGTQGLKALYKAVGGDLDLLLQSSIETAVYELKSNRPHTNPHDLPHPSPAL